MPWLFSIKKPPKLPPKHSSSLIIIDTGRKIFKRWKYHIFMIMYVFFCCIFYFSLNMAASFCQTATPFSSSKQMRHTLAFCGEIFCKCQQNSDTFIGCTEIGQRQLYSTFYKQELPTTKAFRCNRLTIGLFWISFDNSRLKMLKPHPDFYLWKWKGWNVSNV